jgi:pimeloyl-ACP methyl ester carboxylesterase
VAIGAGGWDDAYNAIRDTAAEDHLPLDIRVYHWGHGFRRVLADQMHGSHMRRAGQGLAEVVLRCRQESPGVPISLIGHSAGAAVVLEAAEHLPPGTLEHIILLAPAVSYKHDLRPALASACRGIDVFISERDWGCLGVLVFLTGTTDRVRTLAAGRVGFRPVTHGPEDEVLYTRLRQYAWNPTHVCLGHTGGHYGCYKPAYLRTFVLPLLLMP